MMQGQASDLATPAAPTCDHTRCNRLEEALEKWERRMLALEEKLESLPERLCQVLEGRPPSKSTVLHVQHAMQKAMQTFADAMAIPERIQLSHVSTSPPPPVEPVVVVRPVVASPPPLRRASSVHKASIANLMSASNESLPASPASPVLAPRSTDAFSLPSIDATGGLQPDKPPLPSNTNPQPPYDARPRIQSSIHFTLNSPTDNEVNLSTPQRMKQSPPPSPPRQVAPTYQHSFLALAPPPLAPPSFASSIPNAAMKPHRRESWHPPSAPGPPRPTFAWSDGTVRYAPEVWEFPSTTCRAMWQLWFLGDAAAGIGPFRHLTSLDIERYAKDCTSRKQLSRARTVMNKLIEIAIDHALVTSADDLEGVATVATLDALFDKTFELLLQNIPGDRLQPGSGSKLNVDKAWSYTYSSVHTFLVPTTRKRKYLAAAPPSPLIAPPLHPSTAPTIS